MGSVPADLGPHAAKVPFKRVASAAAMEAELAAVQALGGEGLMLRQMGAPYEHRRSISLLKVKTFDEARGPSGVWGWEVGERQAAARRRGGGPLRR